MKKKFIIFLLLISTLLLGSCTMGGRGMLTYDSDKIAKEHLEQVLAAIANKDKDALRAMFSKTALSEAEDIDGRMEYLFDFFQGKVLSWKHRGGAGDNDNAYGHKTKKYDSVYTVDTDKEKYFVFMMEYQVDTDHPDNVGLYMLQVIKAEDRDTQFDWGNDTLCAGIYMPPEEDDSFEPSTTDTPS